MLLGWKERIVTRRSVELAKRGISVAHGKIEAKAKLKDVEERGGSVNPAKGD